MSEDNFLHGHEPSVSDEKLVIRVCDEPGPGGAHHAYQILPFDWESRPGIRPLTLIFQKGGIAEAGVNGLTNEALLAIVKHRLECFQAGPFPCEENASALQAVDVALDALHCRTKARRDRGVEGQSIA
jgi:hypothetical protein